MDTTKSEVYLTMEKETLVKIIDNKRECIKMLKERIDKAIEYIDRRDIDWGSEEHDKLLDILKGSDKE